MARTKKEEEKTLYRLEKLIPAQDIDMFLTGFYAAVPEKHYKGHEFRIVYTYEKVGANGETVYKLIEKTVKDWLKAELFRRFPDKWGRGTYTLGYFKVAETL